MITKKQIEEWIVPAINIFRHYMPDVDRLPEIHIFTDTILLRERNKIAERLKSPQRNTAENYDSIMEMIHGENGDAIIISQTKLQILNDDPECLRHFFLYFWHEMGHFYAINKEKTDLHRFCNQGYYDEEDSKQEGYWFWSEFIAQVISLHVDKLFCSIDNKENYHPENIKWQPDLWVSIIDSQCELLEMVFSYFDVTIDESALAMFFAAMLKDDIISRFVKAAEDGDLLTYDNDDETFIRLEPGDVDGTCIDEAPVSCQLTLYEMRDILIEQLAKEEFWIIDENWLEMIGNCIVDLGNNKISDILKQSSEWMNEIEPF
ncbi:MAG: hypothetical protein MJ071_09305 [Oscillospiraceae bacterium]|nr:hypothetical protein [Oscillospiraceae bacterium]